MRGKKQEMAGELAIRLVAVCARDFPGVARCCRGQNPTGTVGSADAALRHGMAWHGNVAAGLGMIIITIA